jgi:methyl-accepting chemotaxis protein
MIVPKGTPSFAEILQKLRGGTAVNERCRRQTKGGQEVWAESSINAVADQSGQILKVIEIAADVTQAQHEMIAAQDARTEMDAQQTLVVNTLRQGLTRLAEGDLTLNLEETLPGEYDELRSDFNAAVKQLRDVLQLVFETSTNIHGSATEISQASDDLSRRTESQAAALEETAAAMDELTQSVRSASEGSSAADNVVREAREKAEASGLIVVDAVNAMSEIEKSSAQISRIIGVIDDIAFQTNLLALNAGVEAARAGEAGRGFAVVASEVRALAQRSSEAAKEIKQLISASSRQVENGVGLVGQAGDALKTIVSSVTEISALVSELASSSKEQALGLGEINSGVNLLDQATQQNAAMVEESTAASHSLRQEAEGLNTLVSRFQLGTEKAAVRRGPDVAKTVPARKNAVPHAKPRAVAVGDDWAREFATGTDNQGWESF